MTFLGLDPGASGGLAAVRETLGGTYTCSMSLKDTPLDKVWQWVSAYSPKAGPVFAVLERVTGYAPGIRSMPFNGGMVRSNPGAHMFTFGTSFGMLEMALVAAGIPYARVVPQVWQRHFGLHREGAKDRDWKNRIKREAARRFPFHAPTLATADAMLMAAYAAHLRGT